MPQGPFDAENHKVLVALGSNQASDLGETRDIILAALAALDDRFGPVTASTFYKTPCFPKGAGPDFVNAACRFDCTETPQSILSGLHEIEARFGRTRRRRWGARTLDLDLIAYGAQILPDPQVHAEWRALPLAAQIETAPQELILPHPRLQDRSFVLVPLAEIAHDWVHPVLGQSVLEMLEKRPAAERAEIERI